MTVSSSRVLLAPVRDVWKLVSEPYHLPDWFPGYTGIEPDRRGFAEGARCRVLRGPTGVGTSGLLRRPGAEGTIVITREHELNTLQWHDVELRLDVSVVLRPVADEHTEASVAIDGSGLRLFIDGLKPVPRLALGRLYDLCQTAAEF